MNYNPEASKGGAGGAGRAGPRGERPKAVASTDDAGAPADKSEPATPTESLQEDHEEEPTPDNPYTPLVEACLEALRGDCFNAESTTVRRKIRDCLKDLGALELEQ